MEKKLLLSLVVVSFIVFLVSCPSTTPTEPLPESTTEPNSGQPVATNVIASRLEHADKIRVTWDSVAGADSYKVYRYSSKDETALEAAFDNDTNMFDDEAGNAENAAKPDTPYFYKVSCFINGNESEKSANRGYLQQRYRYV